MESFGFGGLGSHIHPATQPPPVPVPGAQPFAGLYRLSLNIESTDRFLYRDAMYYARLYDDSSNFEGPPDLDFSHWTLGPGTEPGTYRLSIYGRVLYGVPGHPTPQILSENLPRAKMPDIGFSNWTIEEAGNAPGKFRLRNKQDNRVLYSYGAYRPVLYDESGSNPELGTLDKGLSYWQIIPVVQPAALPQATISPAGTPTPVQADPLSDVALSHATAIPPERKPDSPPSGPFSRPVWIDNDLGAYFLFHDGNSLYAYRTDRSLAFFISKRATITGFAVDDASLYVQDGPVLCQYAPETLQMLDPRHPVELPDNAVSLDSQKRWSSLGGKKEDFEALFKPRSAHTFSAPLYQSGNPNQVHVLRSDGTKGTVFSYLVNLTMNGEPNPTKYLPDASDLALYLTSTPQNPRQLAFVSGGKVIWVPQNEPDPQVQDIEAWRWNCLLANTDQPWRALPDSGNVQGFMSSVALSEGPGAAVSLRDPATGHWSFYLVCPAAVPSRSIAGGIAVTDVATGANVIHAADLPAGLIATLPPAKCRAWSGTFLNKSVTSNNNSGADKDSPAPVEVKSAPFVVDERDGRWVYLIGSDTADWSGAMKFFKYKLQGPTNNFVMCWWENVQAHSHVIQRVLAKQLFYSLADETKAAIDSGTVPAKFAPTSSYSSPLWTATAQGAIPWDSFKSVLAAPRYARLTTYAGEVRPSEPAVNPPSDAPEIPFPPVRGFENRTEVKGDPQFYYAEKLDLAVWAVSQLQINTAAGVPNTKGPGTIARESADGTGWFFTVFLMTGGGYLRLRFPLTVDERLAKFMSNRTEAMESRYWRSDGPNSKEPVIEW